LRIFIKMAENNLISVDRKKIAKGKKFLEETMVEFPKGVSVKDGIYTIRQGDISDAIIPRLHLSSCRGFMSEPQPPIILSYYSPQNGTDKKNLVVQSSSDGISFISEDHEDYTKYRELLTN